MPHSPKEQLTELLNSAQENLRENRHEIARADSIQAVQFAEKHFGPHSEEAIEALRPLMELYFHSDEIEPGYECLEKIDHILELRKNQTHDRVYLYNDVAVLFGNKRNSQEALKLLSRALVLSEKVDKGNIFVRVHTLINLGYYHFREDQYPECIRFIEQGLAEGIAVKPYPAPKYAEAAIILARALFENPDKNDMVSALLENALPVITSIANTPSEGTGVGYLILGIIYFRTGHYTRAQFAFDKASTAFEYCQPSARRRLANCYSWMSDNEIKLSNDGRAESLAKKALSLSIELYPEHSDEIIKDKTNLIHFLIPRQRYVEAAPLLEEIISSLETRNGRDDPKLQQPCNNLGFVYVNLERFPLAEGLLRRAQKLALMKSPSVPCPFVTKNLGLMYQKMGYSEKAIIEYTKARKLFIEQDSESHPMIAFIDNAVTECRDNQ